MLVQDPFRTGVLQWAVRYAFCITAIPMQIAPSFVLARRCRLRQSLCAALLALLLPVSAAAQEDVATVRLDGRAVFQVGPGEEQGSASERARRIESRLATLLRNLDAVGLPVARETASGWSVVVSGVPVVSVTTRDAEDNLTTPDALARQWAAALDVSLRQVRERRSGWGGRFVAEIRASAAAAFGRLAESTVRIVPRALAALLVIACFWLIAQGIRLALRALFRRVISDLTVESLFKQIAYYVVLGLGFFVALDALGFDPTTAAAGLGLTGIVLGFALKDILSNFVSGLLILALRPFEIGDQIVVGDLEGSVEKIELRATRMRIYDGRVALVPNAEVFTSRLINNTADPIRRGKLAVYLGYDENLRSAIEAIRAATAAADGVLASPPLVVRVADLTQEDVVVETSFWTDSRRSDFTNTCSAVREAIVEGLSSAKIGLPDPDVRYVITRPEKDANPRTRPQSAS